MKRLAQEKIRFADQIFVAGLGGYDEDTEPSLGWRMQGIWLKRVV